MNTCHYRARWLHSPAVTRASIKTSIFLLQGLAGLFGVQRSIYETGSTWQEKTETKRSTQMVQTLTKQHKTMGWDWTKLRSKPWGVRKQYGNLLVTYNCFWQLYSFENILVEGLTVNRNVCSAPPGFTVWSEKSQALFLGTNGQHGNRIPGLVSVWDRRCLLQTTTA